MKIHANKTMTIVIMMGNLIVIPLSLLSLEPEFMEPIFVCNRSGSQLDMSDYNFEEGYFAGIKNNQCIKFRGDYPVWRTSARSKKYPGTKYWKNLENHSRRESGRDIEEYSMLIIYKRGLSMLVVENNGQRLYEYQEIIFNPKNRSFNVKKHDLKSFKKRLRRLYSFKNISKLLEI